MIVTTSRHCPKEVKTFALFFSNQNKGTYINRGRKTIKDLVLISYKLGKKKLFLIYSKEKIECIKIINENHWHWS